MKTRVTGTKYISHDFTKTRGPRTSLQMLLSHCLPRLSVSKQPQFLAQALCVRNGHCLVSRDMYTALRVPSAHQPRFIQPPACLTQSCCALVLKLLVVEIAGVRAGHVESVPVKPCRSVRS